MFAAPNDAVTVGAYTTGVVGVVAAALAYFVNRRSVAVVELESALKNLREDNDDLREQLRGVRDELVDTRRALHTAEERIFELERKGGR